MENCVVGAPCGVMDQMTSALGEAGSLLALRCQPAEMLPPASLPPHVRLWGIDSGIRHRCGTVFLCTAFVFPILFSSQHLSDLTQAAATGVALFSSAVLLPSQHVSNLTQGPCKIRAVQ